MDKKCYQCNETKPLADFAKDKYNKDGYTNNCKVCRRIVDKKWRQNNGEKVKARNLARTEYRRNHYNSPENKLKYQLQRLKREFGLEGEVYLKMLLTQDNKCAICSEDEKSTRNKNLSVDHCHKSNKVRGLLCTNCNRGLGLLKDNIEVLKKAISYLEKHNKHNEHECNSNSTPGD